MSRPALGTATLSFWEGLFVGGLLIKSDPAESLSNPRERGYVGFILTWTVVFCKVTSWVVLYDFPSFRGEVT